MKQASAGMDTAFIEKAVLDEELRKYSEQGVNFLGPPKASLGEPYPLLAEVGQVLGPAIRRGPINPRDIKVPNVFVFDKLLMEYGMEQLGLLPLYRSQMLERAPGAYHEALEGNLMVDIQKEIIKANEEIFYAIGLHSLLHREMTIALCYNNTPEIALEVFVKQVPRKFLDQYLESPKDSRSDVRPNKRSLSLSMPIEQIVHISGISKFATQQMSKNKRNTDDLSPDHLESSAVSIRKKTVERSREFVTRFLRNPLGDLALKADQSVILRRDETATMSEVGEVKDPEQRNLVKNDKQEDNVFKVITNRRSNVTSDEVGYCVLPMLDLGNPEAFEYVARFAQKQIDEIKEFQIDTQLLPLIKEERNLSISEILSESLAMYEPESRSFIDLARNEIERDRRRESYLSNYQTILDQGMTLFAQLFLQTTNEGQKVEETRTHLICMLGLPDKKYVCPTILRVTDNSRQAVARVVTAMVQWKSPSMPEYLKRMEQQGFSTNRGQGLTQTKEDGYL